MTDQYVYVRHDEHKWVPALLVKQTETEATVSVPDFKNEESITGSNTLGAKSSKLTVKLNDYPNNSLPLQNVTEGGQMKAVADMIELGFLHEAAILFNLKYRHTKDMPYTRTGDIVIACNPYKWYPKLYTDENRTKYSRSLVWEAGEKDYDPRHDLPPHVYETSALAYKGLTFDGQHQSILVSGESGAGKTETVKICMNHLATVVQTQHHDGVPVHANQQQDQGVITRVVDSNPLLEAFGNAKTRRNDNSSRFGKYIQLQFDQRGSRVTLAGSTCDVYLLEKSRVARHEPQERTFHIFYQILAAADEVKGQFWKKLKGRCREDFSYVGPTDTEIIEGVTDADQFQHTLTSLAVVGVVGQELETLMQAICVVLQLGNVVFGPSPKDSDHSVIASAGELEDLADLMGISKNELETTLTQRKLKVHTEETMVPLSVEAAKDSADALAKQIYDRVFLWLVRRINVATTATTAGDTQDYGIIGLLDIFGFESFPINSLEQLCINYANEQLQAKFTKDVFTSVFDEYQLEGIALDEIKYDDNTVVLDLIQNRTGLLAMLNEECIRPNGSDYGFVNKALHANEKSPALIIPRIKRSNVEFGIRHYAGDVLYDATDFVTKNQDTLPKDLVECVVTKSSNEIIRSELAHDAPRTRPKPSGGHRAPLRSRTSNLVSPTVWTKYKDQLQEELASAATTSRRRSGGALMSKTVWTKYKTQLGELMADLEKSESRYIRCIKPNSIKAPKILEHAMTLEQLRSAGVVTAVTMSRAAFPNRMEHEHILDRFAPIWRLFWCRAEGKKLPPKSKRFYQKIYFKDKVEGLLSVALKELETFKDDKSKPAYAVGKTRTYFCAGALEYLEARRFQGYGLCAIAIQSWFRGNAVRKKTFNIELFRRRIRARRGVQGWWRITKAKRCLAVLRHKHMAAAGILRLQCWARMLQAQNVTRHLLIDAEQERRLRQQEVKRLKNRQFAAARIQGLFRGVVQRRKFSTELCVSHKYAEMDDECSQLQRELRELEEAYELAEMKREQDIRKAEKKVKDAMSRSFSAALYDHVMNSPTGRRKNVFETDKVKAQRKLNRKLRKSTQALQEEKVAIKKNCETLKKSNREARGAICDARTAKLKLIVRDQRLEAEAEIWEDEAEKYRLLKITRLHQCEVEKLNRYKYLSTVKKCVKLVKKRIPDTRLARDVERIATEYITTEAARHGKGQDSEVSYYSTTANELSDSSDSSDSSLDDASITL